MTDVRSMTQDGRRRPSDATREKLRVAARAKWDALTPEEQAARKANLVHGPRRVPPPPPAAPPGPPSGGPSSPLDDAPRADPGWGSGSPFEGRAETVGAPPRFSVPDLPPLELGSDGAGLEDLAQPTPDELAGFAIDPDTIADMLSMPFDFVADRRGAHWRLRPLERERLAGAIARKLNQHAAAARVLDASGDWILIAGGFTMILSARLAEDARHEQPNPAGNGARPGLAGLRILARPGGPGRGAATASPGPGPGPVQLDGAGARSGTLNGERTDANESAPADAAEAAGRSLRQAF